jgi:hypothetical protein
MTPYFPIFQEVNRQSDLEMQTIREAKQSFLATLSRYVDTRNVG